MSQDSASRDTSDAMGCIWPLVWMIIFIALVGVLIRVVGWAI